MRNAQLTMRRPRMADGHTRWGAQRGIVSSSCTKPFLEPALAKGSGENSAPIVTTPYDAVNPPRTRRAGRQAAAPWGRRAESGTRLRKVPPRDGRNVRKTPGAPQTTLTNWENNKSIRELGAWKGCFPQSNATFTTRGCHGSAFRNRAPNGSAPSGARTQSWTLQHRLGPELDRSRRFCSAGCARDSAEDDGRCRLNRGHSPRYGDTAAPPGVQSSPPESRTRVEPRDLGAHPGAQSSLPDSQVRPAPPDLRSHPGVQSSPPESRARGAPRDLQAHPSAQRPSALFCYAAEAALQFFR